MSDFIPPADPKAGYLSQREEIDDAVRQVLSGGTYILGKQVEAFESEFAAWLGVRFAIGVASGTDALRLALAADGIGPGNDVITVSHTAVATVAAIELAGARPILIDIDPGTLNMDPNQLERALQSGLRPKAIIVVHLYGMPADLPAISSIASAAGISLIEDAAQAHGAAIQGRMTGTWGKFGCFSFYPTKNLGAFGDAGAVTTDDSDSAIRLRQIREYGWKRRYISESPGLNSRLDELQAAFLRIRLKMLSSENSRRRTLASQYDAQLRGIGDLILPPATEGHVYHQYVIRTAARDRLRASLRARSIGTLVHYPVPVHQQPAYRGRVSLADPRLEVTERICNEILSLPLYPSLSDDQQAIIVGTIRDHFGEGQ